MKFIITGPGQHGKDTACEFLRDTFGFTFESSSEVCCSRAVFPVLSKTYRYRTPLECFMDRHNHRAEWHNLISAYNTPDKARLGKEIFSANDIYCGLRCKNELAALKESIPDLLVIWIDASERIPPEDSSSISITAEMVDYTISNNQDIETFHERLKFFMGHLAETGLDATTTETFS